MISGNKFFLTVEGVPGDEVARAKFNGWIDKGVNDLIKRIGPQPLNINIRNSVASEQGTHAIPQAQGKQKDNDELTTEQRAKQYVSVQPSFNLRQLIVPASTLSEIQLAVDAIRVEDIVYDNWGLRKIEPFPRSALNFHGAPGTGKTLAAHGVASSLNCNILVASYAQIESKFHGDGPKNVEALFLAAQRDGAVLFLDEADSLLSRRLTNVTQGSEQAINSMRSQLLICLEKFQGVVIFATNLVENYDNAFETRVRHIQFPMPDLKVRQAIWQKHLPREMPLSDDVDTLALAQAEDNFCGRDIKNAVIDAATKAAVAGEGMVTQTRLLASIRTIVDARNAVRKKSLQPSPVADEALSRKIVAAVSEASSD